MNKNLLVLFFFLAFVVFLFRFNFDWSNMNNHSGQKLIESGETYTTTLYIKDDPQLYNFSARAIAIDEAMNRRVIVASGTNSSQTSSFKVGDKVIAKGYLSSLSGSQKYLQHQHIIGEFSIEEIISIKHQPNELESASEKFRDRIGQGCSRLENKQRGLCEGLLMGEQQNIDKKSYDDFQKAQLTHLIVASGSNIAFMIGFIQPLLMKVSIRTKTLTIVIVSIAYCCATRFEPSILRATVMVILPLLAIERGYKLSSLVIFASTIAVSLNLDPFLLYRAGFWLSLFASGGLIFLSPILKRRMPEIVANTLAATICVQPVLIFFFGFKVPVLWWASVIGIWIAEPLTTIGMVAIVGVSFLSDGQLISQMVVFAFQIGTRALFATANIAICKWGAILGWGVTIVAIIAYTRGRNLWAEEDYEREHHIYYR